MFLYAKLMFSAEARFEPTHRVGANISLALRKTSAKRLFFLILRYGVFAQHIVSLLLQEKVAAKPTDE